MKLKTDLSTIAYHTREELITIVKDPALMLVFIIANIIYPLLYSIAYSPNQVKEVSIGLIDNDKTQTSRKLQQMINATEGVQITHEPVSMEKAKDLFYKSDIHGILVIPNGFEKDILKGEQTPLSIYCDASYFLLYKQVYSSVIFAYRTMAGGISIKKQMIKGNNFQSSLQSLNPVKFETVELYNPNASYGSFVMPPLILVIIQQTLLIGIGILGGTRKEIKRYNRVSKFNKTKKRILPFLFGKGLAYFLIFMLIGMFSLVMIPYWFGYPHKTSYLNILILYVPYLIANIFLGMSISVYFKRRENALLFMVFLSVPIMFFTGATWPAEGISSWLHTLFAVFPSTFMVPAYLRLRIMGAELHHVQFEFYAILTQCVLYLALAYRTFIYIKDEEEITDSTPDTQISHR